MARNAIDVADHFIERSHYTKTHMQVQKMVYISHGYMLGAYHTPLISDPVEAWEYGPVIPNLWRVFKRYGHNPIPRATSPPDTAFTPQETDVLDYVWNKHNNDCGFHLSRLTHSDPAHGPTPWETARMRHGNHNRAPITDDMTEEYYSRLYGMLVV